MKPYQVDDLHQLALIECEGSKILTWFLNFVYARHLWLLRVVVIRASARGK